MSGREHDAPQEPQHAPRAEHCGLEPECVIEERDEPIAVSRVESDDWLIESSTDTGVTNYRVERRQFRPTDVERSANVPTMAPGSVMQPRPRAGNPVLSPQHLTTQPLGSAAPAPSDRAPRASGSFVIPEQRRPRAPAADGGEAERQCMATPVPAVAAVQGQTERPRCASAPPMPVQPSAEARRPTTAPEPPANAPVQATILTTPPPIADAPRHAHSQTGAPRQHAAPAFDDAARQAAAALDAARSAFAADRARAGAAAMSEVRPPPGAAGFEPDAAQRTPTSSPPSAASVEPRRSASVPPPRAASADGERISAVPPPPPAATRPDADAPPRPTTLAGARTTGSAPADDDATAARLRTQLQQALARARSSELRWAQAELRARRAELAAQRKEPTPETGERRAPTPTRARSRFQILIGCAVCFSVGGYVSLLVPIRHQMLKQDAALRELGQQKELALEAERRRCNGEQRRLDSEKQELAQQLQQLQDALPTGKAPPAERR